MGLFKKKTKYNESGFIDIEVKPLIEWNEPNGEGCIVSDKITKEGWKVGYMYREEPLANMPDSGWRFYKGDEDDDYMGKTENMHVFALNTVCHYDCDIIPYLHLPIGTYLIRCKDHTFIVDDGQQAIYMERQER